MNADGEGLDKLLRFKDMNNEMMPFPFYDGFNLPFIIGDYNKIYDTKLCAVIGTLIDLEEGNICLGFIKKTG